MDSLRSVTVDDSGPTTLVTVSPTGMQGPQGNPTTVNGKTGSSITLDAADVGAVATSAVGAANGVASLDSSGLVPSSEINVTALAVDFMDLATNQTVATGVKTFDVSPVVPTPTTSTAAANKSYVDGLVVTAGNGLTKTGTSIAITAPVSVANGGTGSITQNFVDLTTNQTVAGVKTHTSQTVLSGGAAGSAASGGSLALTSTSNATKGFVTLGTSAYDETNNRLGVRTATPQTALHVQAASAGTLIVRLDVSADTVGRFTIDSNGVHSWGSGSAATDVTLYRGGVGYLQTQGFAATNLTVSAGNAAGLMSLTNTTTTTGADLQIIDNASTAVSVALKVSGDTNQRLTIAASGALAWGTGSAASDVNLYRSGSATIKTDNNLAVGTQLTVSSTTNLNGQVLISSSNTPAVKVTGTTTGGQLLSTIAADATTVAYEAEVTGDSINRYVVHADGSTEYGPGSGSRDTFFGRATTGTAYASPTLVVGSKTALGDNMSGGIALADAGTVPTTNPTGGVDIYSASGTSTALKARLPGGSVQSITPGIVVLGTTTGTITSTSLTAITGLAIAVEANATYIVELMLIINSTVNTSMSATGSWTGPSGAAMQWGDSNQTSDYVSTLTGVWTGDPTLDTHQHFVIIMGYLTTSSTAGTITWQAGCSGTTGSPSYTILAGSNIQLTRVK